MRYEVEAHFEGQVHKDLIIRGNSMEAAQAFINHYPKSVIHKISVICGNGQNKFAKEIFCFLDSCALSLSLRKQTK